MAVVLKEVVDKALELSDEQIIEDQGSMQPRNRMIALLDLATTWLLLASPDYLLSKKSISECSDLGDGSGTVSFGDDFLRFVSMKMVGWRKPVTTLYARGSSVAQQQYSRYTRGGVYEPMCILDDSEGVTVRYFSLPDGALHELEHCVYITKISADWGSEDETIDLDSVLLLPFAYKLAALFFGSIEREDKAVQYEQKAIELLTALRSN